MVDVSNKSETARTALAQAKVFLTKEIFDLLEGEKLHSKKGPVLETARLAGIMATKKTSDLIPLCHPLPLNYASIDFEVDVDLFSIKVICTAKTGGKTGVEMEALTGCTIAALTIYDMCKAITHDIKISEVQLIKKTGGKRDFERTS